MELTRDDERARRICSLALEFMNARAPLTSSSVARAFYPKLAPNSFHKAFARDRAMLADCGVLVEERTSAGEESSWEVNEERSFAQGAELGAVEAMTLELACRPLLTEGSFPFAGELRFALAKLNRAFAESVGGEGGHAAGESRQLAALRTCLVTRHAASATYVDAHGHESERVIAPYGFFDLRGVLYLVAGRIDVPVTDAKGTMRTYRVDRFSRVKEDTRTTFEVPPDFNVDDWRLLPFQIGNVITDATFEVPPAREEEVRRASLGHGHFERRQETLVWHVEASSLADAASWAVAQGIRPLSPPGLVDAWRAVLEGALAHVS